MKKTLLILAVFTIGITAFSQIPTYVPSNSLVGWWPFNGNANDESGNGNNGTVIGAVLVDDRFGIAQSALAFDGINDFVEMSSSFSNWQDFSFSLWFIHTKDNDYSGLISDANSFTGNDLFFNVNQSSVGLKADKNGSTLFSCSLPEVNYNNPPLVTNQNFQGIWNHLVLTKGGNSLKLFLNGSLIQTLVVSASNVGHHAIKPVFGKLTDGDYSIQYMKGSLDDIGIWDRALTECEISDLYNSQLSMPITSTLYQTALDSFTWPLNGQTYTQSGTYTQTLTAANGCDSTITLILTLNFTGLNELSQYAKKLVKITDLNGKIIPRRKNTLMLFIYVDGTVERVVEMEE